MTVEQKRNLLRLYCIGRHCRGCALENNKEPGMSCCINDVDVEKNFEVLCSKSRTFAETADCFQFSKIENATPLHDVISTDENEVTIRAGKNSNVDCVMVYFNKEESEEE